MKLFSSIRNFFFARYVAFVEIITLWMIARTGKLVRGLLLLKGKNPDYVAPPAPAPPPPPPPTNPFPPSLSDKYDPMKAASILANFYTKKESWTGTDNTLDDCVKNPGRHPILLARQKFEEKQNLPPVQTAEVLNIAASQDENPNE